LFFWRVPTPRRIGPLVLCLYLAFGFGIAPVCAQQDFPNQTIRIVLPYTQSAGGAIVRARQLSEKLRPLAGVPVIVEYKPGAATSARPTSRANHSRHLLPPVSDFALIPIYKTRTRSAQGFVNHRADRRSFSSRQQIINV
jgi:tripartite-type tricarboxylate transporter receptor subunit TctC